MLRKFVGALQLMSVIVLGVSCVRPASAGQTLIDDLGRHIVLLRPAQRIISLAPSVTETLYAVGAQKNLVGDTVYCDYPSAAKGLPHVGGTLDPNAEKILALHPDLIIMATQTVSASEADSYAQRWHTPVFVCAASTYVGVIHDIALLGALAGNACKTRSVVQQMRSTLNKVRRLVAHRAPPHVFVVVWQDPLMAAGGASYIGDLVRLAGGINIAENDGAYPNYSPERLLQQNPDVILMGDHGLTLHPAVLKFPAASALAAVRHHRAFAVPSDWTDRPGPRLWLGLLTIARVLHPKAFAH